MSTSFPDLQVIMRLTSPGAKSVKVEKFQDVESGSSVLMASVGVIWLVFLILWFIACAVGAARLSWCYNMYVGNTVGISIFYAILASIFNGFYFPFYGIFLSPLCGMKAGVVSAAGAAGAALTAGGRRR
jgi:hypothetical protein